VVRRARVRSYWDSEPTLRFAEESARQGKGLRIDRYRYVEWQDWETNEVVAREFYDHQSDPLETRNNYGQVAQADAVEELKAILADDWKPVGPM
jgi:hypothetical protein